MLPNSDWFMRLLIVAAGKLSAENWAIIDSVRHIAHACVLSFCYNLILNANLGQLFFFALEGMKIEHAIAIYILWIDQMHLN